MTRDSFQSISSLRMFYVRQIGMTENMGATKFIPPVRSKNEYNLSLKTDWCILFFI